MPDRWSDECECCVHRTMHHCIGQYFCINKPDILRPWLMDKIQRCNNFEFDRTLKNQQKKEPAINEKENERRTMETKFAVGERAFALVEVNDIQVDKSGTTYHVKAKAKNRNAINLLLPEEALNKITSTKNAETIEDLMFFAKDIINERLDWISKNERAIGSGNDVYIPWAPEYRFCYRVLKKEEPETHGTQIR